MKIKQIPISIYIDEEESPRLPSGPLLPPPNSQTSQAFKNGFTDFL